MKCFDDIIIEFQNLLCREDIEDFIARGWVRPIRDEDDYVFEEIDIARIKLVNELHYDMDLGVDALNVVLPLMDQLYEARSKLSLLSKAIEQEPEDTRLRITKVTKTFIKQIRQ